MQYKIPYFHFIIFLFFFSLTDLHSDEECDILCRAGYESESTSEIYENKKNQPQYNSSIEKSLFVENTEQVQKDLKVARTAAAKADEKNKYFNTSLQ